MIVRWLRLLCLVVFLCPFVDAQQPGNDLDEMRFVDAMRKQGFADLALQYLDELKKKDLSPELKAELPIEIARTQLDMASDEPDIARRLALYADVRSELQKFLKANPGSRRAAEIELDVAEIAVMQGRLTLSQAIMLDESDSQETTERLRARTLLKEAGGELVNLDKKLKDQIKALPEAKTPAEKAQRARLEQTEVQAQFNIALNIFDQAQTYPSKHRENKVLLERGAKIEECRKELEKLVGLDNNNPIKWRAMAWLGRCLHELGEPVKARARYAEVIDIGGRIPAAQDGVRLAQYFRLLVINEKAEAGEDRGKLIETGCASWLKTYPRMTNTPEGCGIRFLQANSVLEKAGAAKDAKDKAALLGQARRLLGALEATENDFTDRARRKKIQIILEQGAFAKKVADLPSFEDCYVRAQYEQYEMEKDADKAHEKAKDLDKSLEKVKPEDLAAKTKEVEAKKKDLEKQLEKDRKTRTDTIMAALNRGLGLPDVKNKAFLNEANNARTMLCYYYLNGKQYPECIKVGEAFARDDPRSGQAIKCAAYALQAHAMLGAQGKGDSQKMMEFAKYCKERWRKDLPGDLARHQLALLYLADKKQEEAIIELDGLSPGYPAYAAAQLMLATELRKMMQAEPARAAEFRKQRLAALERIPAAAKGAPMANQAYFLARCDLADEMYNDKNFDRQEQIASALEKDVATTRFNEDDDTDGKMRAHFRDRIDMAHAYARYGRAKISMDQNEFAKVGQQLDPVVDMVNDKKLDVLKSNKNLANAILSMDMRANMQAGKLDRTKLAVQALQYMSEEAGGDVPPVLKQLVPLIRQQIDELQKKKNPEALGKAIIGFSAILDELVKKQEKVNPEFQLVLAQAYNSMTLHDKAAELLKKIPEPPAGTAENAKEMQQYRAAQIQLVRALRAAKDFKGAGEVLKAVMGDPKTGWGRKNVDALKEQIALFMDQEDYGSAYSVSQSVGKALSGRADQDPKFKEQYIDVYYSMVFSFARLASKQKEPAKKQQGMDNAARYVVDLEKRFPDLGGDVSEKRFKDLLDAEPDLKKSYDALKQKK
jgi:hypothetical protein